MFWILLTFLNTMPLAACRNSKNSRFYDTLKMTSFEPEMYPPFIIIILLIIILVTRFSSPDFWVTSNWLRLPKFGTQLPTIILQVSISCFFEFPIFRCFFGFFSKTLSFHSEAYKVKVYGFQIWHAASLWYNLCLYFLDFFNS